MFLLIDRKRCMKILNSANCRKIKSVAEVFVHCSEAREDTADVTKKYKFFRGCYRDLCVEKF